MMLAGTIKGRGRSDRNRKVNLDVEPPLRLLLAVVSLLLWLLAGRALATREPERFEVDSERSRGSAQKCLA